MKLVIVESPTKARTITKFLPKDFHVTSSLGHIRDLPQSAKEIPAALKDKEWARLGVDVDHDFSPLYVIPAKKKKVVTQLKKEVSSASELYLATDEDREGESISWHLLEVLKPKIPAKRLVFHEITKQALTESLSHPRGLDDNLVRAQEARRILDRLVGYGLSPVLWQKIAFGLSAGRVQSVAVRLICERELERRAFQVSQYLGMTAKLIQGKSFEATLISLDDMPLAEGKDFDAKSGKLLEEKSGKVVHLSRPEMEDWQSRLSSENFVVTAVEKKPASRSPYPPFITSSLQQDASRKFGWIGKRTMQVAQKLYEQGYITYMRTDSTMLSSQALQAARAAIQAEFGSQFLPQKPRFYGQKKVKGAQEAHEAIRPAGNQFAHPSRLHVSSDELRLYTLIWQRTLASQMVDARYEQTRIDVEANGALFRANGSIITFPGFLKVYEKGFDVMQEGERELPSLTVGQEVKCEELAITEHETKPPARYTEASLIKVLEAEGIGRPSTYASILSTIEDRGYVRREGVSLKPTFTGMVVVKLLKDYFPEYVDIAFTSHMEHSLDEIADGEKDWLIFMKDFYLGKDGLQGQIEEKVKDIVPEESRSLRLLDMPDYDFRVGKYGAYVCKMEGGEEVCASVPEDVAPADVSSELVERMLRQKKEGGDALGVDPESGLKVFVLTGRYGPYAQLGEGPEKSGKSGISGKLGESVGGKGKFGVQSKPKRVSLPKGVGPEDLTLEQALILLSLPKSLGVNQKSGEEVKMGIGRFGPYVVENGDYRSLKSSDSVFDMTLERALELLLEPKRGRGRRAGKVLKELGAHPEDKKPVVLKDGRFGPYVSWGKVNASLPKSAKAEEVTLAMALELLDKKTKT